MARLPRLSVPGLPHHVAQRGSAGQPVFLDEEDRLHFLQALAHAAADHGAAVHAYSLLDAEFHLLVTPQATEALGRMMQALTRRHAASFKHRRAQAGALWGGRYRCSVLEPDHWTMATMRVIEYLPQDRGLVVQAADWPWSSLRHHLGAHRDPLITDPDAYWRLGNTPFDREAAYRRYFHEGGALDVRQQVLDAAWKGWALGSPAFLAALAERLGRPMRPRPRGRPRRIGPAPGGV